MSNSAVDPIKFEVIRNALIEATEEMTIALRRSAYSTNIKTQADFSCAFFDRQLRPVAQAFAQANHLGSLTILVPRVVISYGPEKLGLGEPFWSTIPIWAASTSTTSRLSRLSIMAMSALAMWQTWLTTWMWGVAHRPASARFARSIKKA